MNAGSRKIGPVLATMLVAGNMVGSGIFMLPVTVAPIGSIAMLGWLVASAGAVLVALALAKLSALRPLTGGPGAQAERGLGRGVGFQTYLLYLIICWVGNLGVAVTAVGYLAALVPALHSGWLATMALIVLYAGMTWLNVIGPRLVCQFDTVAIAAGLLPIVLVATYGWTHFDAQLFRDSWNPTHLPLTQALPQSVLLVFWAYLGLESASVVAAVVEKPERNVPIATVGGVLLAAVVYIAASTAIFGLVPRATLLNSTAPFADATRVLLGSAAAGLIALAALIKTVGTLSGWILLGAQTAQSAAERGFLPAVLARNDARGVPVTALLVGGAFTCLLAVATHSSTLARQFELLAEASVLMTLLVYIYMLLPMWRDPRLRRESGTAYLIYATGGMAFCAIVIGASPWADLRALALLSALLVFAYLILCRRTQAR